MEVIYPFTRLLRSLTKLWAGSSKMLVPFSKNRLLKFPEPVGQPVGDQPPFNIHRTRGHEFHPEGIGVYGWLYGLSEAIYGNNIDQRRARELADAIEAQLEPTGSGRG